MRRVGFIFSLDAFVAFTLTMVTISLLIFIIGTPKPYYASLEQTSRLAHDTLQVMATSSPDGNPPFYLEYALSGGLPLNEVMDKTAGGIIPFGYGYRLETYDFASKKWIPKYDSSYPTSQSGREGRNFTKLRASATMFSSFYEVDQVRGESQYCYLSCFGYNGTNNPPASPCSVTPCSQPISGFGAGQNSVRMVRLVVYT
ncbi:TPA: hypothetical protein HA225_06620 [Candidatus Micrarchaeota archaeon]|nr:hypothetical protein [Candidatus Micrarchaeota archaeon]HIH30871.1 hypothetical protein [Candidatus Micrarchaeota archaeon]